MVALASSGAFLVLHRRTGGGTAPSDTAGARARLVSGGAVCRPIRAVPDDVFGGKVDAPDRMVECSLDGEPIRVLDWGSAERRTNALEDATDVVCDLDDDADPLIVTGPLAIQTYGGDPTSEPERRALARAADLLDSTVTDDLCPAR